MTSPSATASTSLWTKFDLASGDLEFIYNLLLDREVPLTTREMAAALIQRRLDRAEEEAQAQDLPGERDYLPGEAYQTGEDLVFPALGRLKGRVVGVRQGGNPDLGAFDVIQVEFADGGRRREFAARLEDHVLNRPPEPDPVEVVLETPAAILDTFGDAIEARLTERLSQQSDIVRIAWRWFPRALLADIHVGHLNLAEAVLDVAEGGPLPTKDLLEHVELPSSIDPLLAAFSLDYALQEDERFDEVGPAGQVLWFLRRLEPPEVLYAPQRLAYQPGLLDRSVLTDELLTLERDLDDEFSPMEARRGEREEEVILSLLFPHWRSGTLPLSSRLRPLFPTAYEAPRIRFILVDGHTGEKFPGWVVRKERYVSGLEAWYRRHDIPAGGQIKVRQGDQPGEVVVEAVDLRRRHEWVRTVAVSPDNQIGFTMLKQPLGSAFDERMVIGLANVDVLDEAWAQGEQRKLSLERLVLQVFRELGKLNPQAAVHSQSLYSAVNVIRRLPPAPIFAELVTRPTYAYVGDNYFRLEETSGASA